MAWLCIASNLDAACKPATPTNFHPPTDQIGGCYMRFLDLREAVIDNLEARISTHLKSPPGRGKSEFVDDLVAYLTKRDGFEWGQATCFLATFTPSDLLGYMVPTKVTNPDGTVSLASVFTTPPWMMTKPTKEYPHGRHINTYKRGIVFLDEFGQADGDTKKSAAQLMLKGEVGPHRLHEGIGVIAASNGKGDRSGITKDFDFLINRQDEITITDDMASWEEWATSHDVMPLSITFAKQNPQIVFQDGVPAEQGPWTTPRSLVMADKLLRIKAKRNGGVIPDTPEVAEQIQGIMGAGAAQYFGFIKLEREMPKYEAIVKNPGGVKVPSRPDAQMLVCYSLAFQIQIKDAAPVLEYIERLPKEFAVTFATTACKKQPRLVAQPAFDQWARKNSSLMAAIALTQSRQAA